MEEGECPSNTSIIIKNDELIEDYKYKPGTTVFILGIMPTLMTLGAILNCAFLYVVYRAPQMRTVTNLYLVQLSICDIYCNLSLNIRTIWPYARSPIYNFSPSSGGWCVFHDFTIYLSYFVGVNFICIVAFERYFAICRPMKHRMFQGRVRARNTSVACWIVGFLLSVTGLAPQIKQTVCAQIADGSDNFTWKVFHTCKPVCDWCHSMFYVNDTIQFVVVFPINVVLYYLIIRNLRNATIATSKTNKASQDVARMLVINGVAFFFFLGPYQIWNIAFLVHLESGVYIFSKEAYYWLGYVVRICSPINFTINPIIYGGSNSLYREAFLEVFGLSRLLKKPSKQGADSSVSTLALQLDKKTAVSKSGESDSGIRNMEMEL